MEIGWLFRVFACVGRLRCGFTPSKIKQAFSSEIFSRCAAQGMNEPRSSKAANAE
jgi:hypothetical protein